MWDVVGCVDDLDSVCEGGEICNFDVGEEPVQGKRLSAHVFSVFFLGGGAGIVANNSRLYGRRAVFAWVTHSASNWLGRIKSAFGNKVL